MIEPDKLEMFRYLSSEYRYRGFEMALECRSYVERELLTLAGYVKRTGG